ncbi:hypothetical protein VA596_12905 [Amycolatopsis sp., V23-08]|uniref:PH domain-containing protein n=1 Tax=Amycolatopsis heterodermiae TaxID=3110235 RepID=A0ABU5R2P9_9PSEU|nr:hypothetical protein [Amycolatopsis sp., V23-08]MEA5360438.1 hypothetical protein [Amycolatopsis sp., V23-08]
MRTVEILPTITDLLPGQAHGKACACCGRKFSQVRTRREHVGFSDTGSKVYACATCPGADRPYTLRQPWCRADKRPALLVRRHDTAANIVHAKIVRVEPSGQATSSTRALIYFNPRSRRAFELTAARTESLGQWLLSLSADVSRVDAEERRENSTDEQPKVTIRGSNVRSLQERRDRRSVSEAPTLDLKLKVATEYEGELVDSLTTAFLDLEKKFGTRALFIGMDSYFSADAAPTARARRAVPEYFRRIDRVLLSVGITPPRKPESRPFPAPPPRTRG